MLPQSRHFARAIVMPNLVPPVVPAPPTPGPIASGSWPPCRVGQRFEPLMTLYLTEATEPDDVAAAAAEGLIAAVKLYRRAPRPIRRAGCATRTG